LFTPFVLPAFLIVQSSLTSKKESLFKSNAEPAESWDKQARQVWFSNTYLQHILIHAGYRKSKKIKAIYWARYLHHMELRLHVSHSIMYLASININYSNFRPSQCFLEPLLTPLDMMFPGISAMFEKL
jgi:hypothetical protein